MSQVFEVAYYSEVEQISAYMWLLLIPFYSTPGENVFITEIYTLYTAILYRLPQLDKKFYKTVPSGQVV